MCTLNRTAVGSTREPMNTGQGSSARQPRAATAPPWDRFVFMGHRVKPGDDVYVFGGQHCPG